MNICSSWGSSCIKCKRSEADSATFGRIYSSMQSAGPLTGSCHVHRMHEQDRAGRATHRHILCVCMTHRQGCCNAVQAVHLEAGCTSVPCEYSSGCPAASSLPACQPQHTASVFFLKSFLISKLRRCKCKLGCWECVMSGKDEETTRKDYSNKTGPLAPTLGTPPKSRLPSNQLWMDTLLKPRKRVDSGKEYYPFIAAG